MRVPQQCVLVLILAFSTVISATPTPKCKLEECSRECIEREECKDCEECKYSYEKCKYSYEKCKYSYEKCKDSEVCKGCEECNRQCVPFPVDRELPNVIRRIFFQGKSYRPLPPFPKPPTSKCECHHHVTCAYQLDEIRQSCYLPSGGIGVCCPPFRGGRTGKMSVLTQYYPPQHLWDVADDMIESACEEGEKKLEKFKEDEIKVCSNGITQDPGTPAYFHLRVFKTHPETQELQEKAQLHSEAAKQLAIYLKINGSQLNVDAENSRFNDNCRKIPDCPDSVSKYRTASGECNNLNNPEWGMSKTELWRLLPPTYFDGIFLPRNESVLGGKLPLVRVLANTILPDMDKPGLRYTLSVMQWAQFLDHDLTHTPFPEYSPATEECEKEGIECCTDDNNMLPDSEDLHPLCMPIEIPTNDSFFSQLKPPQTCMSFIRTFIVCPFRTKCRFKHAEQINTMTQWIDGSTVYGQEQTDQMEVRAFDKGLLKNSSDNFLPERDDGCDTCRGVCYLAGESRVNEQPGLTMMHTLWMRQHNRIARQLYDLNPHWSDDILFNETRRIIVAQMTHITYNEWLPIIIGEKFMEEYDLLPQREGFSSDYDPTINANINNEFSTAAFRFGHSLVQGLIKLFRGHGKALEESETRLRDNFMTGRLITLPGFFDGVLRGLTRQRSQTMDNHVTYDLKNHLMQTPRVDYGMDLMSLNIQRGRDHGIGTYNDARKLCHLGKAETFDDIKDTIPSSIVEQLKDLYAHVDDIDLFVGGLAETSYWYEGGDGILGPTFRCIVGDQFARLKRADRYYYELEGQAGQFTLEQLDQIRLTSWARIICDNSENLDVIQPLAFRYPNHFNLLGPCNNSPNIPQIDLKPWHDDK